MPASSPPPTLPDRWRISPQAAGERLDAYLAGIYQTSRNQTARWIRAGLVSVGSRTPKPSLRLDGGEWVSCEPQPVRQDGVLEPEEGDISILFKDSHLIVVNKPPALIVHPGAGRESGTLANRLLARFPEIASVGGPGRPGIVHRLDKGTSGLLVVARTIEAYRDLSAAFAERRIEKAYLAIVFGCPQPEAGTIDASIARHPRRRKEMTVSVHGRPARTTFKTLAKTADVALLEIGLETGRTHQIRVHLKHTGHPLVGDPVYGEARWKSLPKTRQKPLREFARPALHAWRLAFHHPETGERVEFTAPVPRDLSELWRALAPDAAPLPFQVRNDSNDL
ncbi:MAG: RluA family pseudouridine synthase [Acidobacteriota bacterium]|nr:RluA family pseudouridine synthase [Acidobacteriota bacterium]